MPAPTSHISNRVVAVAAAIALLYFFRDVLIPFVLAVVAAVLVDALVLFIGRRAKGAPRWSVMLLAALAVVAGMVATAFILFEGASNMVRQAPQLAERIEQLVQEGGRMLGLKQTVHLASLIGSIEVPSVAGRIAGGVGDFVSLVLLMITYFIFIMAGRGALERKLAGLGENRKGVEETLRQIEADIETYVWVQSVTGTIIAAASAAVMYAVGLDNALFWAIVLFILCYIPMIGVTIGSIAPALFALLQFPSWWPALAVFGGIQAAAFVVGNLVYPRMQAETQNIDPVVTLLSLSFWGSLWGLTGAFLAVPLSLMVMMICARFPSTRWLAVLLSNDGNPVSGRHLSNRDEQASAAEP